MKFNLGVGIDAGRRLDIELVRFLANMNDGSGNDVSPQRWAAISAFAVQEFGFRMVVIGAERSGIGFELLWPDRHPCIAIKRLPCSLSRVAIKRSDDAHYCRWIAFIGLLKHRHEAERPHQPMIGLADVIFTEAA